MTPFRCWMFVLTTASLAVASIRGQEAPPPADGVEVSARGPIHEAYAESLAGQPTAAPIVAKKPPEPIEELPPDQKPEGDNVTWMSGYWAFDEDKNDYMWISGFWRTPPPNRQWVPGHWKDAEGGYQWVAGFWGGTATEEVTYLPPPPAPIEAAPTVPQPSPNHTYVSGCWVYRDDHYVWRPGYWLECKPNWIWVPSHYVWSPCGYVYVEGYWDYTLKERGLLFAPVYVNVALLRPGYVYTPTVIVHDECLYGAMFVRPGCRTYYFGDYFEPRYASAGYSSWCTVSVGYSDPMYSYYRYEHRADPTWAVSLNLTFKGRYDGSIARPPVTMVRNTTIVNNTVINNTVVNNTTINNTNISRFTASPMVPLSQASSVGLKLQPVPPEARAAHAVAAKQMVQASHQRAQTEARVLSQGPPPTKPTDKPRTAKLDLPRSPASAAARPTPTPAATHPASPSGVTPAAHVTPAPAATHPLTSPGGTTPPTHAVTSPTHPATTPVAPAPTRAATSPTHPSTTPAPMHPATTPTHPTTTPTHPSTTPTHPAPMPTHPAAPTPARPGMTPTKPGTTPVKPGTTPAKPGTTPVKPGTTPTPAPSTTPPQPSATPSNQAAPNSTPSSKQP